MADYLLDTHIFIWADTEPNKLSQKIRDILSDNQNTLYLSMVTLWEMQIKIGLGKMEEIPPLSVLLPAIQKDGIYEILPISNKHLITLESLENIHKDLFDRLLVAQAKTETLTFLTVDDNILKYTNIHCIS